MDAALLPSMQSKNNKERFVQCIHFLNKEATNTVACLQYQPTQFNAFKNVFIQNFDSFQASNKQWINYAFLN